ncbi:MAG: hypothetical protein RDV48_11835 [Candidatus Eremiobacteraeota bacterium]|nr:hypothetical protein [Candidatus Eremiobacteraeota bacterium]
MEALTEMLFDYHLEELRSGGIEPSGEVRELMTLDVSLNAQGILHYLRKPR